MLNDLYFMNQALKEALKAKGKTSPNPLVGALVVKNNRIIAKGYHHHAGGPHAEVVALDKAAQRADSAKLYVTLEPCSHFGRTGPCVPRIIQSRIREVIIGTKDPNPLNNGRSIQVLRQHGIKVKSGILEDKLKKINESFIKYITKKMPFVTVKVAQSLDGKIATKSGDSKWITSKATRNFTHNLRKDFDAILVGINTVLKDDPLLNNPDSTKKFSKIVVDSKLKIPLNSRILSKVSKGKIIIATSLNTNKQKEKLLKERDVQIIKINSKYGYLNLKDLLRQLAKLEITNLLVEGGGKIIGSLFKEGLVDKVMFFIAPKIIGGKDAVSSVGIDLTNRIAKAVRLKDIKIKRFKGDILIEGRVYRNN